MTVGDDIIYLITPRNLEIRLDIGLSCFEVCFWDRAFNWLAMVPITLRKGLDCQSQETSRQCSDISLLAPRILFPMQGSFWYVT